MAEGESRATIVGDYVSLIRGTTYKGALVGEPGPALLGLGSIEPGGGFRIRDFQTYGGDCPAELMLYPGDIYASLKGATKDGKMIGSVARVPLTVKCGRLTQDTVKLVFRDDSEQTRSYLYWALRTPQYRAYCAAHAMGSAVVALSRQDFLTYPVPAQTPSRLAIVALLDDLDGKIELNRRMNETLEAIARAIFKSWFVDFDPVRAKASGEAPESICRRLGLTPDLLAFFPGRLVDSELGEIPEGWRVSSIGDEVSLYGGATPSTSSQEYWNGSYAWVTPKDLSGAASRVIVDSERKITREGVAKISSGQLPTGTVLMSSRAPIGYLAMAMIPVSINQGFIALVCDKRLPNTYVLQWAIENVDAIKQRGSGTTFAEISKANFRPMAVLVPGENELEAFQQHVFPLYERVTAGIRECMALERVRDALLPRLVSGELRVPEEGAA